MKPNILMIFMDDMGWRDLGCSGSTFYETPNIDALCATGVRLDRAYAACPVCSPSRACFLTGRSPARVGVTDWIDNTGTNHPLHGKVTDAPYLHHLPAEAVSFPMLLQEAGYQTWHVGKWHLGTAEYYPEHFGFDVNIGGCWWGHPAKGYFSPYHIETLPEGPDGEYLIDRLTDEAIHLIRNADPERPFYLNYWQYAVHTPIQAKQEDIDYFRGKARAWGLDKIIPIVPGEEHPTLEHKPDRVMRRVVQSDCAYAAMILNLDRNIGRLVETLKACGRYDNTLIVFTSDNGGLATAEGSPTCNAPASEGKGWIYEGGTRVPGFAVWNGVIPAGTQTSAPVSTADFFPTFLEAAGLPLRPELHMDGISVLPAMKGDKLPGRPLFWHDPHYGNQGGTPAASILENDWKCIEFYEDNHLELYHLPEDPGEHRDLSAEEPELAAALAEKLHAWQKEVGAVFPVRE